MTEASLIVHSWSTSCSFCHMDVLPDSRKHDTVSGYGPPAKGCGATFTAITTDMLGVSRDRLHEMRPDLEVIGFDD
jgi:hypothetical protein